MPTDSHRHSVSVAAAIVDDSNRVLAVRRRDNGHWEPPGGILEVDEGVEEGLIREVQEETGVIVEPVRLSGVYKNMREGIVALVFRCRVRSGVPGPTKEAVEVSWLTADQVRQRMDEAYACRLTDSLASDFPAVRTHDGRRLLGPSGEPTK